MSVSESEKVALQESFDVPKNSIFLKLKKFVLKFIGNTGIYENFNRTEGIWNLDVLRDGRSNNWFPS